MSTYAEIFPDDQPDVIVDKFLGAQDGVKVHYKPEPYDIGPRTIKITDKKRRFEIIGLDQRGKEVSQNKPGIMPVIRGTCAGLLEPVPGSGQDPKDTGIFYIGPGCSVEMNGLRLVHEIPPYGAGVLAHGSATIANLVDNSQESSLKIANCDITTNATAAISIRSDTGRGAVPLNKPVNHIEVLDCRVTGTTNTGIVGGNFSSINLGFWGKVPLDMRHAKLDVRGCTLSSLFFGVVVAKVFADSNSKFLVTQNQVGPTALGIVCTFLRNWPEEAVVLPKGDIDILHNTIRIARYLDLPEVPGEPATGATGIAVRVSSAADSQTVKTTIKHNEIDMTDLPQSSVNYKYNQPIVYELFPPVEHPELLKNVTCHIDHNTILEARAKIA